MLHPVKKLGIFALILALATPAWATNPTGSANQVLVIPAAGGLGKYGQVDLSQSAAVKNQLGSTNGGTGQNWSASSGRPKVASGTFSLANIDLTSEVTGILPAANGGTGGNSSAQTGLAHVTSGTWSYSGLLASDMPTGWKPRNYAINSDAQLWQRGTSTTVSNGTGAYQGDRFYAWNSLGSGGVLTYAQHATGLSNVNFDFDVHVSTAPGTPVAFGINLAQNLDNLTSIRLINGTTSFSAQVKAQNHITQVTLGIGYVTSEAKHGISAGLPTTLISTQTCTVNTSTYTLCKLENVSMSSSVTSSGSYFIVIYASAQSGGTNISDLNNGFYASQVMWNEGPNVGSWAPAGNSAQQELEMAQRFYEKSFDLTTAPGGASSNGEMEFRSAQTANLALSVQFKVTKRVIPTGTAYDPTGGTGTCRDTTGSTSPNASFNNIGMNSALIIVTSATSGHNIDCQWAVDAEI